MKRMALTVAVLLALTACGDPSPASTSDAPSNTAEATFWDELPTDGATLKAAIDADAAAAECASLQETFDTWSEAAIDPGAQADLLTYIDDAMREADCY